MFFMFQPMPGGVAGRRRTCRPGTDLGSAPRSPQAFDVPDWKLAISVTKVARVGLTGLNVYVDFTLGGQRRCEVEGSSQPWGCLQPQLVRDYY